MEGSRQDLRKGEVGDGLKAGLARTHDTQRACRAGAAHRRPAPNTSNTAGTCQHQTFRRSGSPFVLTNFTSYLTMDPPKMDGLSLSDSDSDALFDTPAARKNKKKTQDAGADAGEGAAGGKTRAKESHYTTEENREATLRRELESIRNVNKVIEGVVESLQKAKDNMEVGVTIHCAMHSTNPCIDCLQDCSERVHSSPDLDPHPVPDRAQSTTDPQPAMARRSTRSGSN
jgi:hypothetical protein